MAGLRRKRGIASNNSLRKPTTKVDFTLDEPYENEEPSFKKSREDVIDSDEEDSVDGEMNRDAAHSSSDEEERETVDEKRIRMARHYLSKMEAAEDDSSSVGSTSSSDIGSDEEEDKLGMRLRRERLKRDGMLERDLASKLEMNLEKLWKDCLKQTPDLESKDVEAQAKAWVEHKHVKLCRGHDLTVTCVALHAPSGSTAYSASKDNSLLAWDVESQTKTNTIIPKWNPKDCDYSRNSGEVLTMAASDDGRYLAVGGRDTTVKIYDVRLNSKKGAAVKLTSQTDGELNGVVTTFEGHKGPVTALAFRSQSLQLFSGSEDRCIRHYNLEELAYIETLFGHQGGVTGISCHGIRQELPYSVARDRTARAWKLAEDTHLIFRGGSKVSSADCISAIKDDWFLTGHDHGLLSLWLKEKKKPVASIEQCHGFSGTTNPLARGITCCASVGGSDLAVTGSNDGYMRFWKVSTGSRLDDRGLEALQKIPVHGYINDICIGPKGRFCVAAIGQEPTLGRWDRVKRAKNRFAIIQLGTTGEDASDNTSEMSDDEQVDNTNVLNSSSDDDESS